MPGCYVTYHKQLGDLLLLEPGIARLAAHHGGKVGVMTRSGHAPFVGLMRDAEFVPGRPAATRDALYAFDPNRKTAWRAFLAPAREKWCLLRDSRDITPFHRLVFRQIAAQGMRETYVARYVWDQLAVPETFPFRPPQLVRPPAAWRPDGAPDRFLLVNPTSGWKQKSWKPERWIQAMTLFREVCPLPILVTSGGQDWQNIEAMDIASGLGAVVFPGSTTLGQFLWLCANAAMVVTVDGAASHCASAFDVPCVTLFGVTSRAQWHWPGPRSIALQAEPEPDGKCRLRNLPAPAVAEACRRALQAESPGI